MNVSSEMVSGTLRFLERALERERAVARPGTLEQLRLTPSQVRAQLAAAKPLSPEEVRRAMARQVKKRSCGRGGLPDYAVNAMYADYLRLNSLEKVGELYGRTRQSIYDLFHRRGLALNAKVFQAKIHFDGRDYTPNKNGYYRDTIFRRGQHKLLHHVVWLKRGGEIPAGHQVFLKDGDKTNFAPGNLGCLPNRQVTLHHHRRHLAQRGKAA